MMTSPVDKALPWDDATKAVAQAVVKHLPDTSATEAYYLLVVQHLAGVLWRLGAGHLAVRALTAVHTDTVLALRPLVVGPPAAGDRS
jgi:hypothetical protein